MKGMHFLTPMNFNSRPSARGDATRYPHWYKPFNFNSRPSARGDVQKGNLQNAQVISIHAPPRGATGGNK